MEKTGKRDFVKTVTVVTNVAAVLFIIMGTFIMVLYAQGYRFNRALRSVESTGVITVESSPTRADITLDGEEVGKSTKSIDSIKVGSRKVVVNREGYLTWEREVEVLAQKSSPVFAYLFLKPESQRTEEVFKVDDTIHTTALSEDGRYLFIVTAKSVDSSDPQVAPTSAIKIWRYDTNPSFWNIGENPKLLADVLIERFEKISLLPSPDGDASIVLVETSNLDPSLANNIKGLIINGERLTQFSDLQSYALDPFTSGYDLTWAKDSRYVLIQSDSELIGYDTETALRYLLKVNQSKRSIWSTDFDGNIYFVQQDTDPSNNLPYFRITKQRIADTQSEVVADKLYSTAENTLSELYDKSNQVDPTVTAIEYQPFVPDQQESRFTGEIQRIFTPINDESIIIETEHALYRLDTTDGKIELISPVQSNFIAVSPDFTRILFRTENQLGIYTYDKEDQDHTVSLGTRYIKEITVLDQFKWHWTNQYVEMSDGNQYTLLDINGTNNYELFDTKSLSTLSGSYLYTFDLEKNTLLKVKVH